MPEPPALKVAGTVQARDGSVLLVLDSRQFLLKGNAEGGGTVLSVRSSGPWAAHTRI